MAGFLNEGNTRYPPNSNQGYAYPLVQCLTIQGAWFFCYKPFAITISGKPQPLMPPCPLCTPEHETILWQDDDCRIILVPDACYSGFCRVIWQAHVKEMSDLSVEQRQQFMAVVLGVEEVLREILRPDKINLASLGNQVPHLHWHVIPRFADDAHFPDPIWATARRAGRRRAVNQTTLAQRLQQQLSGSLKR